MFRYGDFMDLLDERKSEIENLKDSGYGFGNFVGKARSAGCDSCQNGTNVLVFVTQRCNCNCTYCPQFRPFFPDSLEKPETREEERILRSNFSNTKAFFPKMLNELKDKIKTASYSGGEPMLVVPKVCELAQMVSKEIPCAYQWMYTNGVLATEDKLKQLADSGIKEVRFDWAATKWSDSILKKMEIASKHIDHVTIEVPMWNEQDIVNGFLPKLKGAVDAGVSVVNCIELLVTNDNAEKLKVPESELYLDPEWGGISPYWSRLLTYSVMEYVEKNKIDVTVFDCCNETRSIVCYMRDKNNVGLVRNISGGI